MTNTGTGQYRLQTYELGDPFVRLRELQLQNPRARHPASLERGIYSIARRSGGTQRARASSDINRSGV